MRGLLQLANGFVIGYSVVAAAIAGVNALLFRRAMLRSVDTWDNDAVPPGRIRLGALLSLGLWAGVIATGRMIAYDWWDCHKQLPVFMYHLTGCIVELEAP